MSFIVCVCSLFMFVWTEVYLHRNCLFACINVPVIDFLWNRGGWMQEVLLSIGISVGRRGLRLVLQLLGWVDHTSLSPAHQPRIMHLILQKITSTSTLLHQCLNYLSDPLKIAPLRRRELDKAPRLSISIVIWILSSDSICQLNQFNKNSEAAMLSTGNRIKKMVGVVGTHRIHPNHPRHWRCHHTNVRPYLGITWPRFSGCSLSPRFRLYQPLSGSKQVRWGYANPSSSRVMLCCVNAMQLRCVMLAAICCKVKYPQKGPLAIWLDAWWHD